MDSCFDSPTRSNNTHTLNVQQISHVLEAQRLQLRLGIQHATLGDLLEWHHLTIDLVDAQALLILLNREATLSATDVVLLLGV